MHLFQRKHLIFWILLVIAVSRLFHFGNIVDEPHAWRQYDTKQYIEGYYYDGNSFLEPSVCWMGGHETLVLEFPLPEYIIAQLYSVFGPELWVARTFFMVFFLLTCLYLFKALKVIFDDWVPELATIIFGFTPLSIFYSRAIHIDFFALFFAFAMLYYLLIAIKHQKMSSFWIALAFSIVAFVEKAPYVFYLAFPLLVFAVQQKQLLWILKRAIFFVIPIVGLFAWNNFAIHTNSNIPDWYFIPGFNKFTEMTYWYFGTWEQRMNSEFTLRILGRLKDEILGLTGMIVFGVGLLFYKKQSTYWFVMSWLFGAFIYAFIFFNLNIHHNYYQIPFIAPFAIIAAMGIQKVVQLFTGKGLKVQLVSALSVVLIYVGLSINYAEENYYVQNTEFESIAKMLKQHTKRDDLVVFSYGGLTPQCPLILQPAQRKGWSIPQEFLMKFIIESLRKDGNATKLAIVYDGYFSGELKTFFEAQTNKKGLEINKEGRTFYICDLKQ